MPWIFHVLAVLGKTVFSYRKSGALASTASLEKGGEEYEETNIGTSLPLSAGMGVRWAGNGRFPCRQLYHNPASLTESKGMKQQKNFLREAPGPPKAARGRNTILPLPLILFLYLFFLSLNILLLYSYSYPTNRNKDEHFRTLVQRNEHL